MENKTKNEIEEMVPDFVRSQSDSPNKQGSLPSPSTPTEDFIRTTISFPKNWHKELLHKCIDLDTSMNEVIKELIYNYLHGKE